MSVDYMDYDTRVVIRAHFEAITIKKILRNFLNRNAYYYGISEGRRLEAFDEDNAFQILRSYSSDTRYISVAMEGTIFSLCFTELSSDKIGVWLTNFGGRDGAAWRKKDFLMGDPYYDLARYSSLLLSATKEFAIESFETGYNYYPINNLPSFDRAGGGIPFIEACPVDCFIHDKQAEIEHIILTGMQKEIIFFDAHFNRLTGAGAIAQEVMNTLNRGDEIFYNVAIQHHFTQIGFKLNVYDQLIIGIVPQCASAHALLESSSCEATFFLESAFELIGDFGVSAVTGQNLDYVF